MAHMVETMAYAGELPWHGLGVKVIDDLSPEQMICLLYTSPSPRDS